MNTYPRYFVDQVLGHLWRADSEDDCGQFLLSGIWRKAEPDMTLLHLIGSGLADGRYKELDLAGYAEALRGIVERCGYLADRSTRSKQTLPPKELRAFDLAKVIDDFRGKVTKGWNAELRGDLDKEAIEGEKGWEIIQPAARAIMDAIKRLTPPEPDQP